MFVLADRDGDSGEYDKLELSFEEKWQSRFSDLGVPVKVRMAMLELSIEDVLTYHGWWEKKQVIICNLKFKYQNEIS